MSDLKEYVTQIKDQSNVHISEEAICTVAAMAAVEVDGVVGLSHLGSDVGAAKKNLNKAIRLRTVDDTVEIDLSLQVRFGNNIQTVAREVQESVRASVESIIGLTLGAINVYVSGIVLDN